MNCKNCEQHITDTAKYCPNCGQAIELKRIDGQYILQEIGSVLNFKKGILYTIRELLIRPGQNIRAFINEDRHRLVKPIIFIIVCSLIYTISNQLFHFEDNYVRQEGLENSTIVTIFEWIQKNYGYANIIMGVFIAFWIKIFFKKYGYNFFEILILVCFIMGIGMLMYAVFGIIESLTEVNLMGIAGIIGLMYSAWAIGQFFDKGKKINYFKGFLSYFLGMMIFFFAAIILGLLIDLMI